MQTMINKIQRQGFRVFLSNRGNYGFFTDKDGTRLISFQSDLGGPTFSGNYKTDKPTRTGTGWRISDKDTGDYKSMFNAYPPLWALSDSKWQYTTLDQHLKVYQQSSGYREL